MTEVHDVAETVSAQTSSRLALPRGWLGVGAVAAATFTVVTAEMLPVGLLTPIGATLRVTEGTAGLALTVTGLVAAVSAPLLTSGFGMFDRRWVLCVLLTVLALGNLAAAWSPNFAVFVVGRVLIGIGMGGVWALAAAVAVRLVPPKSTGTATSVVFSGVAIASVLGIPAGAFLGALVGWRIAFVATALLAFLVLLMLAALLPPLPASHAAPLRAVLRLSGNPQVSTGLLLVAFLVTGHFAAYTYVRPILEELSGASSEMIGTLLLVYGIAGILGNFVAGAYAARSPRATLLIISAVLGATVLALFGLGGSRIVAAALIVVWGLAYGGVSVSALTWFAASAPDHREEVSALLATVFNAAIAVGALLGGLVADHLGSTAIPWLGGALVGAALLTTVLGRAPETA
ncbi:MFS transporter [Nocardia sp. NPDC049707]|uniref:MFS transporter n=1 Tax=Nocardia sp. NPDC049707 TaxID=3154735 RepID=UPI00343096A8